MLPFGASGAGLQPTLQISTMTCLPVWSQLSWHYLSGFIHLDSHLWLIEFTPLFFTCSIFYLLPWFQGRHRTVCPKQGGTWRQRGLAGWEEYCLSEMWQGYLQIAVDSWQGPRNSLRSFIREGIKFHFVNLVRIVISSMERTRVFFSGLSDQSSKPWMDIAYPVNPWSLSSSSSPTSYNVGEAVLSGSGTSSWLHCFACKWILHLSKALLNKWLHWMGPGLHFHFSSGCCSLQIFGVQGWRFHFSPLCGCYTLPGANASGPLSVWMSQMMVGAWHIILGFWALGLWVGSCRREPPHSRVGGVQQWGDSLTMIFGGGKEHLGTQVVKGNWIVQINVAQGDTAKIIMCL